MSAKMNLVTSCVNVPQRLVPALHDMIDNSIPVTYRTFRARVGDSLDALAMELGYDRSFPIKDDWHIEYRRSKWLGRRCYYLRHSAIEYIFQAASS